MRAGERPRARSGGPRGGHVHGRPLPVAERARLPAMGPRPRVHVWHPHRAGGPVSPGRPADQALRRTTAGDLSHPATRPARLSHGWSRRARTRERGTARGSGAQPRPRRPLPRPARHDARRPVPVVPRDRRVPGNTDGVEPPRPGDRAPRRPGHADLPEPPRRRGSDLGAYDTAENAADVADLRVALGLDEWNVYGVSYGSDLALTVLRDHPDGVRSVVLDSVVPTQSNIIGEFWPNAAEGYRALFDACAAQPACAGAYPGLADEFTATVNRLAAAPLTVDLPSGRVVIDGYTLANLVIQMSLAAGTLAGLPALIHAIAGGEGDPAATALAGTITPPGLIGYGLSYGVFCAEDTAFTDREQVRADAKAALPQFPDSVLSLVPQAARIFDDCDVWDVPAADAGVHDITTSDVPTLLRTGSLDAVTPPSRARAAAETLSRSDVLVFPGLGHDVLQSSQCAPAVTVGFLENPGGDESGRRRRHELPRPGAGADVHDTLSVGRRARRRSRRAIVTSAGNVTRSRVQRCRSPATSCSAEPSGIANRPSITKQPRPTTPATATYDARLCHRGSAANRRDSTTSASALQEKNVTPAITWLPGS
ncbi:MAG: alpha/beta hydrolase [Rhodococcus sp. (in: high G+C Gram-positive bacteria)]|nr:MAG: alpha/beta hydrolase [Rhodococcus sp. (in: high G+C Gram-positive bacteria)]